MAKEKVFDTKDDDILALTTNYLCNEWLDASDKRLFERMKVNNPRRYQVAGLGNWGIVEGLIYENWREEDFTMITAREARDGKVGIIKDKLKMAVGLNFGYTNDPTAFFSWLF